MACGCTTTCGCVIQAGVGINVMQMGDTFIVSLATGVPASVADTDSVELDVTGGVLTANVLLDPASTAPVSIGPAGLRVDCCENEGFQNLFIQDDDPGPLDYPYLWIQYVGPNPDDFTMSVWIP